MGAPRILHYPGSKWLMADWIIERMPKHMGYLEPFFGSGAVFFNKTPAKLETVNDLNGNIVNLFKVIREKPEELAQKIHWTPYARDEYELSYEMIENDVEKARRFMVRCWMSRGALIGGRSGWRSAIQNDGAWILGRWNSLPDQILEVTKRLQEVQIENKPAVTLINRYRESDILIYADPPYLEETRRNKIYANEMTDADHRELLDALDAHTGPVLLSGYANQLYDNRLKHWNRETKEVLAEGGAVKAVRTEVLWINPIASESMGRQLTLF